MRVGIFGIVVVACVAGLPFMDPDGGPFAVTSGLATGAAIPLIDGLIQNRRWITILWLSLRHRNEQIRISAAYLYRIKVGSSYLLIVSKRFDHYIPVGGVYKYALSAKPRLDELEVLTDDLIPIDESSQNDLRIRVPGKNLLSFFKWFESAHSRETSPWREFWEELIEDGILSAKAFPWIFERRVRQYVTPLHFSSFAQCNEINIADIYELEPSPAQLKELERLHKDGHTSIMWADADQIRRRGATPGKKRERVIGEPAEWIL